jgi:3-deoxy-manno-octulosonate cytidylyltransferase (CMP-KDO synthetase)
MASRADLSIVANSGVQNMTRIIGVIPARMGSSRFPGKPLAPICGVSMVEHVYQRTRLAKSLDAVYLATCDEQIASAASAFGGNVIMTSPTHERATDRVAEVARSVVADIYVMVQGDEPLVLPEMIDRALEPILSDPSVQCTNLAAPILTEEELLDRNTIKVVMRRNGDALYMSREAIPTRVRLSFGRIPAFKQVCIMPFRRDFLLTYSALEPTELEQAESIDMLRALEHGYSIRMVRCEFVSQAVDTFEDLRRVERLMATDPLFARYDRRHTSAQASAKRVN